MSRILYCEDDVDSGRAFELTLLHLGHHVDYAQTADQAVQLFDASRTNPYDLLITDVDMPGHTGMYFASHARQNGYVGRLIVLTGMTKDQILSSLTSVSGEYWPKSILDVEHIESMVNEGTHNRRAEDKQKHTEGG